MAVRSGAAGGAGAPGGHRITGDPTRGCRGGAGRGLRLGAGERAMIATGLAQGDLGRPHRPPGAAGAGRPCRARSAAGPARAGSTVPRRRRPRPGRPWPAPRSASWTPIRPCASGSSTRPGDRVSPRQIAARLRFENPDDGSMRICHEQIHPGARVRPGRRQPARPVAGGQGPAHRTHPPHTRAPHWPEKPEPRGRSRIPGRRPPVCARPRGDEGAVPGHWEADLIIAGRPPAAP